MLEQLLSEIVEARLTETLNQFRLAPQIKPHMLVEVQERLAALDIKGELDLITRVNLSETKASIQRLIMWLYSVILRKRTNGTKHGWLSRPALDGRNGKIKAFCVLHAQNILEGRIVFALPSYHQSFSEPL